MTNTALIEEKISASGLKKSFIASKIGLTPYGLSLKINNKSDFKSREISALCVLLDISIAEKESIFFAEEVAE